VAQWLEHFVRSESRAGRERHLGGSRSAVATTRHKAKAHAAPVDQRRHGSGVRIDIFPWTGRQYDTKGCAGRRPRKPSSKSKIVLRIRRPGWHRAPVAHV
jgi:hypothetical protein